MDVDICQAGPERLPALARLFGVTFVDEPMMRGPLGDHGDVAERFTRAFAIFLEGLFELGMVWEVGDAVGAAVWVPAGGWEAWQETQRRQDEIAEVTLDGGRRWADFWAWVEAQLTDEPLWYLDSIAVAPEHQGQGIGAALVEFGLARAAAESSGAVLETGNPRNVGYYERFGFRTVFDADAPGGGPHVWFMRWAPA